MEDLPSKDPEEPVFPIPLENEVLEGRRSNTALFTFAGAAAMYDGILYEYFEGEDEDGAQAAYITADHLGFMFGAIKKYMLENNYRCVLNMNEVPGFILKALGHEPEPLALPEHAPEPQEDASKPRDLARSPNYVDFGRVRNKPVPGAAEVPIQIFSFFMQKVDAGEISMEVALDRIAQMMGRKTLPEQL